MNITGRRKMPHTVSAAAKRRQVAKARRILMAEVVATATRVEVSLDRILQTREGSA